MKTKEQLVSENAALTSKIETWSSNDVRRRTQFSKVIGRTDNIYGTRQTADLSWEEIFCEIGKLMAFHDFHKFKQDIEFRMDVLKSEIHKPE